MHYRFFFLLLTILICVVVSVAVHVVRGIDVVYTHLFYIPIVLTGIWYPRFVVPLAASLGLIHIVSDYVPDATVRMGVFIRAAMFLVVGCVTGYLSTRLHSLLSSLKESEERYRTLVEHMHDIVFRTDKNGYFTYVNPAALRIAGYHEEEIIGKHYSLMISPEFREKVTTFFERQFVEKERNTYVEFPIITKDGQERWIGQNTQLLMEGGHVTGFQAVARDITERRRAEKERRHREKLQGVLEMAGAVCHEMNQPMQIISGYSELLMRDFSESDPLYEKLRKIVTQVERMKAITEKLMTIQEYKTQDYAGLGRIVDIHRSSGTDAQS